MLFQSKTNSEHIPNGWSYNFCFNMYTYGNYLSQNAMAYSRDISLLHTANIWTAVRCHFNAENTPWGSSQTLNKSYSLKENCVGLLLVRITCRTFNPSSLYVVSALPSFSQPLSPFPLIFCLHWPSRSPSSRTSDIPFIPSVGDTQPHTHCNTTATLPSAAFSSILRRSQFSITTPFPAPHSVLCGSHCCYHSTSG